MSFSWTEYFTLAQEIMGLPVAPVSDEARARCALSRAYYAVYHVARATAQARDNYIDPPPGTGNVHKTLAIHFRTHPDPPQQEIGLDLNTLRTRRGKMDYDDVVPPGILADVWIDLQMADHLLAKLAAL